MKTKKGGESKSLNNNDDDNSSFENTQKDSLLGASNDENLLNAPGNMDLLGANNITVQGNTIQDIYNAISSASAGIIFSLEEKLIVETLVII